MRQLFATLGMKIPIVQAPMGGAVPVRLAAAVSNVGHWEHYRFGAPISKPFAAPCGKCARSTSKPFAVNLVTSFSTGACRSSRSGHALPIVIGRFGPMSLIK